MAKHRVAMCPSPLGSTITNLYPCKHQFCLSILQKYVKNQQKAYPYRKVRSWQACRKLVLSLQQKYELVLGHTRLSRGPASSPTNCALLCKLAQANMNTFVRAYVSFSTRCKLVQAKMNKFVHAGEFNYQMQA